LHRRLNCLGFRPLKEQAVSHEVNRSRSGLDEAIHDGFARHGIADSKPGMAKTPFRWSHGEVLDGRSFATRLSWLSRRGEGF
jgi:hypothetical protein